MGCTPDDVLVVAGRDYLYGLPGEFTVVRCRSCRLMRTNPRPTADSIAFYYPDEYGPFSTSRVSAEGSDELGASGMKRRLREAIEFNVERLPPVSEPGRMLEVGCASGAFLDGMARKGWDVAGIEPSVRAGRAAQELGHRVHIGTVEDAPDPDRPFDMVVGWMVLEHTHDPLRALRRIREWTRPGGWLVLSVPNAGALEFRAFGEHWFALQLPTHLYHFTPQTLRALLAEAGWSVQRVHHQRTLSNLIASLGLRMENRSGRSRWSDALRSYPENRGRKEYYLFPLARILAGLGQTGRMTVWAQKHDA